VEGCPSNLPIIEQSYRRGEVLSGPERRRRWSVEEKARIVAESLAPNAVASAVARRHGVHPNQLYAWRRELRPASAVSMAVVPDFVPVLLAAEAERSGSAAVEICLAGAMVRVAPGVDLGLLGDVLRLLKAPE